MQQARLWLAISLLLLPAAVVAALDNYVVAEAWIELDPIVADGAPRPLPRDMAMERLMQDIRQTVSGLVYGYDFEYVPGDPARGISERFTIEPHAEIVRGDQALTVLQTWIDDDRLVARVGYELSDSQYRWYTGWNAAANARSTGVGRSSLFLGPESKFQAVTDGVRDAVRELVRSQEFTRPQLVTGAALLAASPAVTIRQGNYQARVDVFLQIDEIERFRAF